MSREVTVSLSTASVFPFLCTTGFEHAAAAGFDGVEVMVWSEPVTRDAPKLRRLSRDYEQPIHAIHAPSLFWTQLVWGVDPWVKLERSAQLAYDTGARTVVVHPPFRWQPSYAAEFADGVAALAERYNMAIAVENMYPWRVGGGRHEAYLPGWDPRDADYADVTLDLSHTATSQSDAFAMAQDLGSRLRHLHLADGLGSPKDEHLMPGEGNQPCVEVLQHIGGGDWPVNVVLEVSTKGRGGRAKRLQLLRDAAQFARQHLHEGASRDDV